MIFDVSVLVDDVISKPTDIAVECIHTKSVDQVIELSVCEVNHILPQLSTDEP